MTVVTLQCPLCSGAMQVDAAFAGQVVACPHCQGSMVVPPAEYLLGMPSQDPPVEAPPVSGSFEPAPPPLSSQWPADSEPPLPAMQPSPNPAAEVVPLSCPVCTGMFQAAVGQQVACPYCGSVVMVPPALANELPPSATQPQVAPAPQIVAPAPITQQAQPAPQPQRENVPLRKLTREEKAQRRFRNNLIVWSLCFLALLTIFFVLVWPSIRDS